MSVTYEITDQTSYSRVQQKEAGNVISSWVFPKIGLSFITQNEELNIYGAISLKIPRSLIAVPASTSDEDLASQIAFMSAVVVSSGGGVSSASNGLTVTAGDVKLGGGNPLTSDTTIDVATFALTMGALKTASGGVVIGGAIRNPLAVLDLQSTTKGFLIPRMTQAELDAIPITGFSEEAMLVWVVDSSIDEVARLNFWSTVENRWNVIASTSYVQNSFNNSYRLIAGIDGSINENYPAGEYGQILLPTSNGRVGGVSGKPITVDDFVLCINQNAGGDEAAVGANWKVYKGNISSGLLIGAGTLNSKAVLQLEGTDKGVLINRMTTAQRLAIPSPPDGLIVFDTDLKSICWYDAVQPIWRVSASQSFVNNAVLGVQRIVGSRDCSTFPDYPAAVQGDSYYVNVSGKIGGALGPDIHVGDFFFAIADNAGGDQATVGSSWIILEANTGQATTATLGLVALATNGELLLKSDTQKAATAAALEGFVSLNHNTDCSTNPNYPAGKKGDTVRVTVGGFIGGTSGKAVSANDLVVCAATNAGGNEASVGTNWILVRTNALVLTEAQMLALPNPTLGMEVFVADLDNIGIRTYNGSNWNRLNLAREEFIISGLGQVISFTPATGGGGSAGTVIPSGLFPSYNGSTGYYRRGIVGCATANTTSNSRGSYIASGGYNLRFIPEVKWYVDGEISFNDATVIDFANDPVLKCFGLLSTHANSTPLEGAYFRPQRLGETAFIKMVIRTSNTESTPIDTIIPTDNNVSHYLKLGMYWDGTDLTFFIKADLLYQAYTISGFAALFPNVVAAAGFAPGLALLRNGAPSAGSIKTAYMDAFSWWHSNPPQSLPFN